jgi:glucose-1-phosphate thymidylyltransferase
MQFEKGILLAGGSGTRLKPLTTLINKHLLTIYDKPMIFYSLSILMLSKIREIVIITNKESLKNYQDFFEDGSWLGMSIDYIVQEKPSGIADTINLSEKFIAKSNFCLMLGDNLFYGSNLTGYLEDCQKSKGNFKLFTYKVKNPSSFGVLFNRNGNIYIHEKPKRFIGNDIVTGLYFLPNEIIKISKKNKKSKRGELEISDSLNSLMKVQKPKIYDLKRGITWMDLGSLSSLNSASDFIKLIQNITNTKIACLEEISLKNKWIKKISKKKMITKYGNSEYFEYLKKLNCF